MHKKKVMPGVVTLWRIRLALVMFVPSLLTSILLPIGSLIWWLFTALWVAIFLILYAWYFPLLYNTISYFVASQKAIVTRGAFTHQIQSLDFDNIQYVSLRATPLQRALHLHSLYLFAAGGHIVLPGLSREEASLFAEKIHQILIIHNSK